MNIENTDCHDMQKQLSIELGTEVQINLEDVKYRFKGILVGLETNNWLLIKMHHTSSGLSLLVFSNFLDRKPVVVRYLHNDSIFGFQSELLATVTIPTIMIFLKYPKIIEEHNLRAYKRVDCFCPAKIVANGNEYKGALLDISEGGCKYVTKDIKEFPLLTINEQIDITFTVPGIEKDITMTGKIKYINAYSNKINLGINFVNIQPEIKSKIIKYISEIEQFW